MTDYLSRAVSARHPIFSLLLALAIFPPFSSANEEIGFIETFSLADDRAKALEQLIPGTEDFYYFHALHAQNLGRYDEVEEYFEPWLKRYGETARFREIRHRQALLRYPENRKDSLTYLIRELGLRFNHQQERLDRKPEFPIGIDPEQVTWEVYRDKALRESNTLSQFEDKGLDRLIREDAKFDQKRLRDLLSRLPYPDYPRLVGLIASDLRSEASRGFGEFPIHLKLLPEQLDELQRLRPTLSTDTQFVHLRLRHLRPSPDVDWTRDAAEREAYLDRLWEYAKPLEPAFNSLKAHILYQLLQHHQRLGQYPRDLFLDYLKLPRQVAYVEPRYLQDAQRRRFPVDLNADFQGVTACPPIRQDEALVRDYLLNFFIEDENWNTYAPFIRDTYLKAVFAEAKLTNGIGDAERWFSLLSPSAVQALKERVDIEFAPGNPENFDPGDPVSLDVFVKNAGKLIVKVYEINSLNFFLEERRELNTDLDLDGLIPNEETAHEFEGPPIQRQRHTFTFDSLADRRGAWVIELIGNGRSSRALVRKGRLQYLAETTSAGTAVTVLTQDNQLAKSPSIWFGGRRYRPVDGVEDGMILLPFTNQPGNRSVVLTDGDFATLEQLDLPSESYRLNAGFHVDRENLLPGRVVEIAVRPDLRVNGQAASVSVLEKPRLVIRSRDHEGIESVTEVPEFALFDDRESLHEFRVPERLGGLEVTLQAEIRRISDGASREDLSISRSFEVNSVDRTEHVADFFLSKIDDEWVLEVLGKTGEPLEDRAVRVSVKHRDTRKPIQFSLKTDESGRVALSRLDEHVRVDVSGDGLPNRSWDLQTYAGFNRLPASIHSRAGEVIEVPVALAGVAAIEPKDVLLLETRANGFVGNAFGRIALRDGLLQVTGLAPGDYEMFLRGTDKRIVIRITGGQAEENGYALSRWRHLQVKNAKPLQVASLNVDGDKVTARLVNANEMTRVHLVATRFVPEFPLASLGRPNWTEPQFVTRGSSETLYLSGRDIGEEYRYILERRAAKRFPGNMLDRPNQLLNPWALRDTETSVVDAEKGEAYDKTMEAAKSRREGIEESAADAEGSATAMPVYANYDFLRNTAPIVYNLVPNEEGVISLDLEDLGDRQHLHLLAVDDQNAAYRQLSLGERDGVEIRDLRLTQNLDAAKHFSQRQKVTMLGVGDVLDLPDIRSSQMETYDTLAGIWAALSGVHEGGDSEKFAEFAFLLEWPRLDEARKRELFSKNACHELAFFLSRRDPEFFASTVKPYLANKREKTFLDHYLVEADLVEYSEPWAYGRLNIVERILLARRLGGDNVGATARHVEELASLTPISPERSVYYFRSALLGKATWGAALGSVEEGLELGFANGDRFDGDQSVRSHGRRSGGLIGASEDAIATVAGGMAVPADAAAFSAMPMAPAPSGAKAGTVLRSQLERKSADAQSKRQAAARLNSAGREISDERLAELRQQNRALFRKLEATQEWAENNYHHLPIEQQLASLVTANPFWQDYAAWDGDGGFYSREFPLASSNFTEMMLALAVLDVPFESKKHDLTIENGALTLEAKSPVIVFHEEVEETEVADDRSPILVSQNFFRSGDRYRHENGRQSDKFVTEEFLTGVLYGGQVVATNPTSSTRDLEVLLQVPRGSLPANGSKYTDTSHVRLEPFSTRKLEYYFYFPAVSGEGKSFPHYPVHVSQGGEVIAWAEPFEFTVVDQLSTVDKASWDYLSQFGTEEEVIAFLEQNNVFRLNLARIAWRCRENVDFFRRVISLLEKRHAWDQTLWSYGLFHDDTSIARQYLLHREDFLSQSGRWIEAELVSIDPIARHWYQHLEYQPLVNARSHRLGRDRKILNDRFRSQYQSYLGVLSYQSEFAATDDLGIAYYLFLQDRIEEALARLAKVDAAADGVESRLQLDYLRAYASFYLEKPAEAAEIAAAYADYPVDRWRERFGKVAEQAAEIGGENAANPARAAEDDREQQQEQLAATEANIEMKAEGRTITLDYRNLEQVRVNYYEMDLEFLFSSNPFVSEDTSRFSFIRPNVTLLKDLPKNQTSLSFDIPEQFASRNVLVEIVGGGQKRSAAVYANSLKVQLVENYGRLEVRHADTGKPLPKVYVKVYGRFGDGNIRFFKDGYTDLRGRFDYVSLNTNELDDVQRLSLLVLSDGDGALVREVAPPQR